MSRSYSQSLTTLLKRDRNGDAMALFMERVGTPPEAVQQMRTQSWWSSATMLAPTLAYDSAIMCHRNGSVIPADILSAATTPTLVVRGGNNAEWWLDTDRQLADDLPNGRFRELTGQNHEVDPGIIVPVVEEFFDDVA